MDNELARPSQEYEHWSADKANELQEKEKLSVSIPESPIIDEVIGRGGNSIAYSIKDHPDLVLMEIGGNSGFSTGNEEEALLDRIELVKRLQTVPSTVNVARTLKAYEDNGKVFTIIERALGAPVHSRDGSIQNWQSELESLAQAPLEQYRKMIQDARILQEYGFSIDPSKPDNFYYDQEQGFQFIDVAYKGTPSSNEQALEVPIIFTYNLFTRYRDQLNDDIKNSIRTILDKFKTARDKPLDYDFSQIEAVLDEQKDNNKNQVLSEMLKDEIW